MCIILHWCISSHEYNNNITISLQSLVTAAAEDVVKKNVHNDNTHTEWSKI